MGSGTALRLIAALLHACRGLDQQSRLSLSAAIHPAHVLGAVHDLGSRPFDAVEKPHRRAIDKSDVPQVEDDATVWLGRQQLL
jgi:hypothetical protein